MHGIVFELLMFYTERSNKISVFVSDSCIDGSVKPSKRGRLIHG